MAKVGPHNEGVKGYQPYPPRVRVLTRFKYGIDFGFPPLIFNPYPTCLPMTHPLLFLEVLWNWWGYYQMSCIVFLIGTLESIIVRLLVDWTWTSFLIKNKKIKKWILSISIFFSPQKRQATKLPGKENDRLMWNPPTMLQAVDRFALGFVSVSRPAGPNSPTNDCNV